MSENLVTPDLRRMLGDLARRIGILERRISGTAATPTGTPPNDDIIFSYVGELAGGSESPPTKLRYGGFLTSLAVAFGTAGSSTTTLEIEQNGTVIATVTIASGIADQVTDIGARVAAEDRITVEIVTAGTGAADMTAAARFT